MVKIFEGQTCSLTQGEDMHGFSFRSSHSPRPLVFRKVEWPSVSPGHVSSSTVSHVTSLIPKLLISISGLPAPNSPLTFSSTSICMPYCLVVALCHNSRQLKIIQPKLHNTLDFSFSSPLFLYSFLAS